MHSCSSSQIRANQKQIPSDDAKLITNGQSRNKVNMNSILVHVFRRSSARVVQTLSLCPGSHCCCRLSGAEQIRAAPSEFWFCLLFLFIFARYLVICNRRLESLYWKWSASSGLSLIAAILWNRDKMVVFADFGMNIYLTCLHFKKVFFPLPTPNLIYKLTTEDLCTYTIQI